MYCVGLPNTPGGKAYLVFSVGLIVVHPVMSNFLISFFKTKQITKVMADHKQFRLLAKCCSYVTKGASVLHMSATIVSLDAGGSLSPNYD